MTVTVTERQNASEVIKKMAETLTIKEISHLIGINQTYVSTTLHRTRKRNGENYFTPEYAIRAVLDYVRLSV